jgi:hypothetical protein
VGERSCASRSGDIRASASGRARPRRGGVDGNAEERVGSAAGASLVVVVVDVM